MSTSNERLSTSDSTSALTTKKYPVELAGSAGEVTINGTLTAMRTAIRAEGGSATVNGNLIIRSRDDQKLTSCDGTGTVTVTGESKIVAP